MNDVRYVCMHVYTDSVQIFYVLIYFIFGMSLHIATNRLTRQSIMSAITAMIVCIYVQYDCFYMGLIIAFMTSKEVAKSQNFP